MPDYLDSITSLPSFSSPFRPHVCRACAVCFVFSGTRMCIVMPPMCPGPKASTARILAVIREPFSSFDLTARPLSKVCYGVELGVTWIQ